MMEEKMTRYEAEKLLDKYVKYQDNATQIRIIFFELLRQKDPSHYLLSEGAVLAVSEPNSFKDSILEALFGNDSL